MADLKISLETEGGGQRPTDRLVAVRAGANVKVYSAPVFDIRSYLPAADGTTDDNTPWSNMFADVVTAGGGICEIWQAAYALSGGLTIPQNCWIRGNGFPRIIHTGNNSCFTYDGQKVGVYSDDDIRGGIDSLQIWGNTGASAAGLEVKNSQHWTISNVNVGDLGGTHRYTNGTGLLLHNDLYWTENLQLNNFSSRYNKYGIRLLRDGSGNTSMGYHRWRGVSIVVPANGTGVSIGVTGSGILMYSSDIDLNIWLEGDNGIGMDIGAGSTIDESCRFHYRGEVLGSTASAVFLKNRGTFNPNGQIDFQYGAIVPTLDAAGATKTDTSGMSDADHLASVAQGFKGQTDTVREANVSLLLTSQSVMGELIGLKAGQVVSSITVHVSTAGSGLTGVYVALYDKFGNLKAVSADNKANFTTTGAYVTTALTTPYLVQASDGYYLAVLAVGTTPPTLLAANNANAATLGTPASGGVRLCVTMPSQTTMPSTLTLNGSTVNPIWMGWA